MTSGDTEAQGGHQPCLSSSLCLLCVGCYHHSCIQHIALGTCGSAFQPRALGVGEAEVYKGAYAAMEDALGIGQGD